MFKSALAAVDGSPISDSVAEMALALAKDHGVAIKALGVLDEPGIRRREMVPPGGAAFKDEREEAQLKEAHERLAAFLGSFAARCKQAAVACEAAEVRGVPSECIAEQSVEHDLILIGRQAHSPYEARDTERDTYRRLASISPRPILAVPAGYSGGVGDALVAYDGSQPSARAVQLFELLGLFGGRRVRVVSIHKKRQRAQAEAGFAARFLASHGRDVESVAIESDSDANDILMAEIETLKPCVLVMGCFGHAGLKELFFGTTTENLLFRRACPAPVFLYH